MMKFKRNKKEEETLFENRRCKITLDLEGKVRIENLNDEDMKLILPISNLIMDLNNMPSSYKMKKKNANDIKNIYLMALNNKTTEATEYAKSLKCIIERNLYLERTNQYSVMALTIFFIIIIIAVIIWLISKNEIFCIFVFSSLGGILSLLVQYKKLEIDYNVEISIINIESVKRVILSIAMGCVGYIAVKANIIFADMSIADNKYILFLIIIICGYSTNFIPNLLDSISKNENIKK